MITDQSKRRVPGDVREQFVDNWVKSIVPGDLADKLDEYESVRANVNGAHSNDTRYRPTNNKFVSDNKGARHLARECPKNTRKTPPRGARSNIITAKGTELEIAKQVVNASVPMPVSVPINTKNGIDDLRLVDIKCGQTFIKAVIDTGAQILVLREDLIDNVGEKLFDFGNQRDFEGPKDKDIEFRKEMEELRKETENETRIREARHKEEEPARLKAEEEAKAVEEKRRMVEERRMDERIALEKEMRLKKERWLVEEQIRHVQEEHKMGMKEEQKCLPEERCKKKSNEKVFVFKNERAQILNVDPDAVPQPVAVEKKRVYL
ncbi:uncharacterized protein TNCV_737131 [Trichonephila clavipes]|nr:uncharacterized protein TNCV_737131 [Trichonephila clavipes]